MGDTSERSKTPSLPPRCQCGFWGSSDTRNLCSQCYTDVQKQQINDEPQEPSLVTSREGSSPTDLSHLSACTSNKRPGEFDLEGETPPLKLQCTEEPAGGVEESRPKQKNRRRCFRCQTRLVLVQQELGSCRCGHVFCPKHRLPEQHDCVFDHQRRGREEAVLKMVKMDRKAGRECS